MLHSSVGTISSPSRLHTGTHIHTYTRTRTHTHTHAHKHTHTHTHTHIHTHTHTHAHKHAHTHTHTRTPQQAQHVIGTGGKDSKGKSVWSVEVSMETLFYLPSVPPRVLLPRRHLGRLHPASKPPQVWIVAPTFNEHHTLERRERERERDKDTVSNYGVGQGGGCKRTS